MTAARERRPELDSGSVGMIGLVFLITDYGPSPQWLPLPEMTVFK
jgi:hypothetical protein